MRLSNILKAKAAHQKALSFVPPKLELGTPDSAKNYIENKKAGGSFRMSDVIRIQTGIKEIEAEDFNALVEEKAIEKLKEIEEAAYQEAHKLGLEDGMKEAFKKHSSEIEARLKTLDQVINNIAKMKTEIFQYNEAHIVKLTYHMASRLAHAEITADPERIKEVIRSALEIAQSEENVVIQVAPTQLAFLENLQVQQGREFDFIRKVKFEANSQITEGGCVIDTNYGSIDSRFEERVKKLWEGLSENLYKVKDKISAA